MCRAEGTVTAADCLITFSQISCIATPGGPSPGVGWGREPLQWQLLDPCASHSDIGAQRICVCIRNTSIGMPQHVAVEPGAADGTHCVIVVLKPVCNDCQPYLLTNSAAHSHKHVSSSSTFLLNLNFLLLLWILGLVNLLVSIVMCVHEQSLPDVLPPHRHPVEGSLALSCRPVKVVVLPPRLEAVADELRHEHDTPSVVGRKLPPGQPQIWSTAGTALMGHTVAAPSFAGPSTASGRILSMTKMCLRAPVAVS